MSLEIEVMFRRRTNAAESHEQVHRQLMQRLTALDGDYWQGAAETPDFGAELLAEVDVSSNVIGARSAGLNYTYRSETYIRDAAKFDDHLCIAFDKQQLAPRYADFARTAFPGFVTAFDAYRASITLDLDLALEQWDECVELGRQVGGDLDGRDGVWRIDPVCYFDRELCRRAFDLAPEQIVDGLRDKVELCELIGDGAFILVTTAMVGRDELIDVDKRVRGWLGIPSQRERAEATRS